MNRFLELQLGQSNKVPPIEQLLKSIKKDENTSFYTIANSLRFNNHLNPIYTLVSLRDIAKLSPINYSKEFTEDELKPSNSFRWLYLIHSLASRTITDDQELESAKVNYVFQFYTNFLLHTDITKKYMAELISGVLCAMAHLIESTNQIPDILYSPEIIKRYHDIFSVDSIPECKTKLSDFSVNDIFLFCSSESLEYLSPNDLFSDPKLTLQIAIIRILSKLSKESSIVPNLKSFQDKIIPFCYHGHATKLAKRTLIQLFNGDEEAAFNYSDNQQYEEYSKCINEKAQDTKNFKIPLSYNQSVELSQKLTHIQNISTKHPQNWISYLNNHPVILNSLISLFTSEYDIGFVSKAATILRIGEANLPDCCVALNLLISSSSKTLREEISKLLLNKPEKLKEDILHCFPLVCNYGSRSDIFFSFLAELIPIISNPTEILHALINSIYAETARIKDLPNAHIYTQLSKFIDVPASYLDPQPCTVCNNQDQQMVLADLCDIKDYFKYTHDQIFVKLAQPYMIQMISLKLGIKKKFRVPRTVEIYVSSAEINTPADLISKNTPWNQVGLLNFSKGSTEASKELPLGLFATCLQFRFTQFWEDTSGSSVLKCPACHAEIKDRRSGICPKCKENAYQCNECRSINYNHLDAFICCECGYSNFVTFSWFLSSCPTFSHTHIVNEKDCDASLKKCDQLLDKAHTYYEKLTKIREKIEDVFSPSCSLGLSGKASKLNDLYNEEGSSIFQNLTGTVSHVCAIRSAISRFKKKSAHLVQVSPIKSKSKSIAKNMCYNCKSTYIKNAILFFDKVTKYALDESLKVQDLLFEFANENSIFSITAVDSLAAFCSAEPKLMIKIIETFINHLPEYQPHLVRLLCELERVNDEKRIERLRVLLNVNSILIKFMNSSSFTSLVLQPITVSVFRSPLIIRNKDKFILYQIMKNWYSKNNFIELVEPKQILQNEKIELTNYKEIDLPKPIELFTKCSSSTVRNIMASLIKDATSLNLDNFKFFSNLVVDIISHNDKFNQYDEQLYDVLSYQLENSRQFLIHTLESPFFDHIVDLLCNEVDNILSSEENITLNLCIGLPASILMNVLKIYLSNIICLRYVIYKKTDLIVRLFISYFKLRSLLIQRSKYLENCLSMMKNIIMNTMLKEFDLNSVNQPTTPEVKQETNTETNEYSDYDDDNDTNENRPVNLNQQTTNNENKEDSIIVPNTLGPQILLQSGIKSFEFCPDIVIREISSVIFPPKQVLDVPLLLKKQPTQEDYIPGRLSNSTINSKTIGETFQDIKTKICSDLNMPYLLSDDHGMELLVDNNIIGLSLSISEVYHRIWKVHHGDKPMVVYCRLQGLDGEATEPMIESFPSEEKDDEPPEIKYAYTQVLCEDDGFAKLLNALQLASSHDNNGEISDVALFDLVQLLETFSSIEKNRNELNKLNAIDSFFELLSFNFKTIHSSELMSKVISTIYILINADNNALTNKEMKIKFIFDSLDESLIRNNTQLLLSPFLALIPPIASGQKELQRTVISLFLQKLHPSSTKETKTFHFFKHYSSLFMLNGLAEFTLALPMSDNEIRDLLFNEPIVNDAITYLEELFPLTESRTSEKWTASLEVNCLPMLLKFLAGMVHYHQPTQNLFNNDLIKLLISLETVVSSASIGEYAAQVIRYACDEPSVCKEAFDKLKNDRLAESKEIAHQQRDKAMEEAKSKISPELLSMIDTLEDESCECCICKEGYTSQPKELLGVYVYMNIIDVPGGQSFPNTATYFVCIHPQCHVKSNTPNDKNEWEGASLRNCERPCNAIFPLPHSSIPIAQYREALQKYIGDHFSSKHHYAKLFFLDVQRHIDTISKGEKIPPKLGGGSLSSIIEFLPFLIYAGHVFLDVDIRRIVQETKLQKLLDEHLYSENATTSVSIAQAIAIQSIWIISLEEWDCIKLKIFRTLLRAENKTNTKAANSENELFLKLKNALLFYILVNRLQTMLKVPTPIGLSKKENGDLKIREHKTEKWLHDFEDTISNDASKLINEFLDFADELETEILVVGDFKTALLYAEINEANENPYEWIKSVIQ